MLPEWNQAAPEVTVGLDIDMLDLRWRADGPPHGLFKRMRTEAPVYWYERPDGIGYWSVFRHADIHRISHDTETFSSARGGVYLHPDQQVPLELMRSMMLVMDPPQHTRYRRIVSKVFTPLAVAKMGDDIRARVNRTIDNFIEKGSCDFVEDFAVPVPLGVLLEMMGVPQQDAGVFYDWTERLEQAQRVPGPLGAVDVFEEMSGYLAAQIEQQTKAAVEDSLVMRLRNAEVDGEKLNDMEIVAVFGLLAFAGNDTTRNTISTGLRALIDHPQAMQELRDNPALIPTAIEEILRWTSVVQWFARTATRDVEVGGQRIAEGDKLVLWYGSGSRDEAVFENADTFDIHREKPNHMAFGGGGRHICLGASLARLELRIVFEEVLSRMRDIRLAGTPELVPTHWVYGYSKMPITFTPGSKLGA